MTNRFSRIASGPRQGSQLGWYRFPSASRHSMSGSMPPRTVGMSPCPKASYRPRITSTLLTFPSLHGYCRDTTPHPRPDNRSHRFLELVESRCLGGPLGRSKLSHGIDVAVGGGLARMTGLPSTCPWPCGADRSPPWHPLLAAIGTVESDNGQSSLPGVHSGANAAGAEGTLQFEPATFRLGSTTRGP